MAEIRGADGDVCLRDEVELVNKLQARSDRDWWVRLIELLFGGEVVRLGSERERCGGVGLVGAANSAAKRECHWSAALSSTHQHRTPRTKHQALQSAATNNGSRGSARCSLLAGRCSPTTGTRSHAPTYLRLDGFGIFALRQYPRTWP